MAPGLCLRLSKALDHLDERLSSYPEARAQAVTKSEKETRKLPDSEKLL
jgi:hypothetical protein